MNTSLRSAIFICASVAFLPSCESASSSSDGSGGAAISSGGSPASIGGSAASIGGSAASVGGTDVGGANLGGNPGEEVCAGLNEAECEAQEVCRPALGWTPEPGSFYGGDFENRSYQGCRYGGPPDNEWGCGLALTCGFNPNGGTQCWEFSDNCLPIGWTFVSCEDPCPVGGQGGDGGAN